jgi:pyrimidine operon attenuation protein/uracil phosphoribosyltransferase
MEQGKQVLMQGDEVERTITRMAHEIVEKNSGADNLALIGIRSKGAHLVRRIAKKIEKLAGAIPPVGVVDVRPYRDDVEKAIGGAEPPPIEARIAVDDKTVILVDDVIYRGRTIRAALEIVEKLGRPKRVLVAILVDRGARELPIRADIIGKNVSAPDSQRVNVLLQESDGVDQVTVTEYAPRK